MASLLIDEMFPAAAAEQLRSQYGADAAHVSECGLAGAADTEVAAWARANGHAVVTDNVADFVGERDLATVFVLKRDLPAGGGQATALAQLLHQWAAANSTPYLGPHWPRIA